MSDKERGLYGKFIVSRTDGSQKHNDCEFFVLDLEHDPFARAALLAYATACEKEFPLLAKDIRDEQDVRAFRAERAKKAPGCPKPEKQSPALPDGTWQCTKCRQRGLTNCSLNHVMAGYPEGGRPHFHQCECCKGEGVHREEVRAPEGTSTTESGRTPVLV